MPLGGEARKYGKGVKAGAGVSKMGVGRGIESRYPRKRKIIEQNWA